MVTLYSYGAKHNESLVDELTLDKVFSCHYIRNPYHDLLLRTRSGLDEDIQVFVYGDKNAKYMLNQVLKLVQDGATAIAFECYGGKHRSVAMAEISAEALREQGFEVQVNHISLGR